jgi:hypothetical protein
LGAFSIPVFITRFNGAIIHLEIVVAKVTTTGHILKKLLLLRECEASDDDASETSLAPRQRRKPKRHIHYGMRRFCVIMGATMKNPFNELQYAKAQLLLAEAKNDTASTLKWHGIVAYWKRVCEQQKQRWATG